MTTKWMHTPAEAAARIEAGERLVLAGEESLLAGLPKGSWIGGTIPYFVAEEGGAEIRDRLFVNRLPDAVGDVSFHTYDEKGLERIYGDTPAGGFGIVLIPALTPIHLAFALGAPRYSGFATRPLIGWITGVHLSELGKTTPKVVFGPEGRVLDDRAVAIQAALPADRYGHITIFNIFEQGSGASIVFDEDGFSVREAKIDGRTRNLAEYMKESGLDERLPLVADYCGTRVNISFQKVDADEGRVDFYAPVFKGMEYRQAAPIDNYVKKFTSELPHENVDHVFFSCNCILNYLYSELEGKSTAEMTGPMTFGEVAYQLLNQTLVSLTIEER